HFCTILHQKSAIYARIIADFFFVLRQNYLILRCVAVLRVCDLFCNDGKKRRNTNVFQGFLTKLQGKTVAQNRFLTVAHRPSDTSFFMNITS
ncbi:MAG: hypothetical protein IJY88_00715, partial [Clostridia bacterium]|nr:hypothetical protein [Clostridia bacterium]